MKASTLLSALALVGLFLLAGCQTDHATWAAASSSQPGVPQPGAPNVVAPAKGAQHHEVIRPRTCSCQPVGGRTWPRGEVYGGVSFLGGPAAGGAVEFGQVFARSNLANWSFEIEGAFEDLNTPLFGDDGTTGGTWAQAQGGVKASFLPLRRGHPTARAGFTWFRATEDTKFISGADDYFGFYVGAGYEWDVSPLITTGPEVSVVIAAPEKSGDFDVIPQFQWHVIFNF